MTYILAGVCLLQFFVIAVLFMAVTASSDVICALRERLGLDDDPSDDRNIYKNDWGGQ